MSLLSPSMTLPHVYRLSIPRRFAKWYSDQQVGDTNHLDGTWESEVRIAPGQDAIEVLSKLKPLLLGHHRGQSHRWHLCSDGQGIRRSFRFKDFNKTWVRSNDRITRYLEGRADLE